MRNRRRRQPPCPAPARPAKRQYLLPVHRSRYDAASSLEGYRFRRQSQAGSASGHAIGVRERLWHVPYRTSWPPLQHGKTTPLWIPVRPSICPGPPREACPNDWRIGACVCLAQVVESPPGCLGRTETAALGASCPGFWENSRCITRDGSAKSNAPERRGFGRACVHTRGETPLAGSGGTAATGSVFARRRSQTLWGGSGAILPSECLLSSCPAFCRCRT